MSNLQIIDSGVSVVICCYNSSKVLPKTLEHLSMQIVSDSMNWEVVVIDNASTDETAETAIRLWKEYGSPTELSVFQESTPGLSAARKLGTLKSRYETLIFCDDDNWLCDSYVSKAYEIMKESSISVCGGEGNAVSDVPLPDWFKKNQRSFAVGPQANETGSINAYPYGAGMVLRTSVLQKVYQLGFESQLSDRKGKQLSSGGDGEISEWMAIIGAGNWYFDSALKFDHYIDPERLSLSYLNRLNVGFGQMTPVIRLYKKCRSRDCPDSFKRFHLLCCAKTAMSLLIAPIRNLKSGNVRLVMRQQTAQLIWLLRNRKRFIESGIAIRAMHKTAKQISALPAS